MNIDMDDSRIQSIAQLAGFLNGASQLVVSLEHAAIEEKYRFIDQTVDRFRYPKLKRNERHTVYRYLRNVTGYQKAQLLRLIKRAVVGRLTRKEYRRINPNRIYTGRDVKLLEKTDELHLRLSDRATQEILRREYERFDRKEYQTLAHISHGHITNLRHHPVYRSSWVNHTKARLVPIGHTQAPENYGRPGSIRVDTVSQRDIYHINAVDEITQWEVLVAVPVISEICMLPALSILLDQFPFMIFNFHSDRGGEAINYLVASFLQKLLINQTKSRARHPNDNALVETKNGSVVRKNMGWEHIHQQFTDDFTNYYRQWFNPYLNFHRPCAFPTVEKDERGKSTKVYRIYQTPYEALKGIPEAHTFLKPEQSFTKLDTIAYEKSDNEFAEVMRNEERKLFEKVRKYDRRDSSRRQT